MLTVALTGGIGSGKTAVTDLFYQLAVALELQDTLKIIDADTIARSLLAGSLNNSPSRALKQVYEQFGSELFDFSRQEGGLQLNRTKLRALIFSSQEKKLQLEKILHPLVYEQIFSLIHSFSKNKADNNAQPAGIIIIAIPLLFETHAENKFDRVLVVDVPVEVQIKRTIQRDHCSRELLEQIICSQVDRSTRLSYADDVIDNSKTPDKLQPQVEKLFHFYLSLERKVAY